MEAYYPEHELDLGDLEGLAEEALEEAVRAGVSSKRVEIRDIFKLNQYTQKGDTMKKPEPSTRNNLLIAAGIIIALFLWGASSYNRLINLDASVTQAWADVETQYQRRLDLIPNLVNTVKGYAQYERELYTAITRLRSQWYSAQTIEGKIQAANVIDSALGRLIAVAENYPQLRASENFLSLQDELAGTENRVAVSRTRYNAAVKDYNAAIKKIPANMIASTFGFQPKPSFTAQSSAEQAPPVTF